MNIQATAPVSVNSLTFGTSGAQLYTIGGAALNLAPAATITTDTDVTINSAITGAGTSLIKNGTGTLTFFNAKTYTGTTTVNAGELVLRNASGFVSATTVNSGAKLTFTGTTSVSLSAAAAVTLNDGATLQNINPSGYVQLLGAVTVNGNTTINANQVAGTNQIVSRKVQCPEELHEWLLQACNRQRIYSAMQAHQPAAHCAQVPCISSSEMPGWNP